MKERNFFPFQDFQGPRSKFKDFPEPGYFSQDFKDRGIPDNLWFYLQHQKGNS